MSHFVVEVSPVDNFRIQHIIPVFPKLLQTSGVVFRVVDHRGEVYSFLVAHQTYGTRKLTLGIIIWIRPDSQIVITEHSEQ